MIGIGIKGNLSSLHRSMIALGAKQVPFAMSLALNTLAKGVAADQVKLIDETFDTPTPFTEKAYRIEVATKSRQVAVVAAKDIQAKYLEPYVVGGNRSLWSKKGTKQGMIVPKQGRVSLNAYGNLTKGKMATLRGKPNVFVGPLRTKNGLVSGVWQGHNGNKRKRGGPATGMKLLIAFKDTTPVPKHLPFEQRARTYLRRHAAAAFTDALTRALSTRR